MLHRSGQLDSGRLWRRERAHHRIVSCFREIGIAETDPSGDVDGWDAAIKIAALATVLMNIPLQPASIDRTGIRGIL